MDESEPVIGKPRKGRIPVRGYREAVARYITAWGLTGLKLVPKTSGIEGIPGWLLHVYPAKAVGNSWARLPEKFRIREREEGRKMVFIVTSSGYRDITECFVVMRLGDWAPMFVASTMNDTHQRRGDK